MNSPTAHAHMGDFGVRTPFEFDAFNARARTLDARFKDGVADEDLYYLIRLGWESPEGELVGAVSLSQRRARDSQGEEIVLPADVGWCVREGRMGRGYATEAAGELMRFAREEVGWKEMVVFASERNPASNRVAEKLEFVEGGKCPDLDCPGGWLELYVLPVMERIDETLKVGLGFGSGI